MVVTTNNHRHKMFTLVFSYNSLQKKVTLESNEKGRGGGINWTVCDGASVSTWLTLK